VKWTARAARVVIINKVIMRPAFTWAKNFAHLPQVSATASTSLSSTSTCSSCFLFYVFASKILLLKCKIENGSDVQARAVKGEWGGLWA